ncbi:hypothetical protein [Actinomadura welshii]|uniref:nSTAND1 domain-containing NTPase n=1 Tax=Actinomadura welshii TaxID=3103817 RepID=UPI0003ACE32E|nr:hypothetical protein [Actinomadura madurae]
MPRPERALDPDAGPLQRFAHELRELRRQAGEPGYRQLAEATRFSASALAAAARGERLPSLQVTLAYVEACDGDRERWRRAWHDVRRELAGETEEHAAEPPYLGLSRYEAEDAGRFFGRAELVDEILARLDRNRFVAVFGPSGSGKSSLLRAGVVPRLGPGAAVVTPGAPEPLPEAEALIVDQFEEVFTLHPDASERHALVDALLDRPGRVVIAVRADFYGHCAEHPGLTAALRNASVLVGSMRGEDLREAIVKPAANAGLMVEPALVARVIQDAGTEPGALPLISHALLETWKRRKGKNLTLAGYDAAGGVHGAIADTAESVYRTLPEAERQAARRLLLRMVNVTETGPGHGTRRPAHRSEGDGALIERLAGARLVAIDGDTVEIAHEALIRTWPRLRDWISADQEGLRLHRRLGVAAAEWEAMGRDEGDLHQGARLDATTEWADAHPDDLTVRERAFLDASIAAEQARRAAVEHRTRTLQGLVAALSVLLLVATGAGTVAVTERVEADDQRRRARSRQLAAEAMARLPADVPGAADRAVRAHRTAPTLDARSALLSIAGRQPYQYRLAGHAGMVKSVAFSPDGRELATGGQDGAVITWDPERRVPRARFASSGGAVRILEYSPDGRLLATADLGGVITLWRTSDHVPVRRMRMAGVLDGLAFSPDGRRLAAAGAARTAAVWDVATGREVDAIDGHGGLTTEVAYAPDGRTVAIAGDDGRVALWRPDDDRVRTVKVGDALLTAVAFSPDGRSLAAAGDDDEVHLLDLESGEERGPARRMQHTDTISALAFTDGGRTLVSSGYDRTVKLWETASRTNITTLTGHSGGIYDIAVSPDGNRIASAALDQTTLVWDLRRTPYIGHTDWVNDIALDPGGKGFVSVGQDGGLRWWDTASRRPAATVSAHPRGAAVVDHGSGLVVTGGDDALIHIWRDRRRVGTLRGHTDKIYALDLAPDGRTLAAADQSGALILWDVPTRRRTAVLKRGRPLVKGLAFGPHGRMLATGDDDRAVTLWDVQRRQRTAVLPGHPGRVASIAISPDGRLLAAGGGGGEVLLWDLRHRRRAGRLRGHAAEIRAIAFSPSGRRLATAGLDRTVVVWDVSRRSKWAVLTGHSDVVLGLDFSRDDRTLLSSGGDQTITTWDLDLRRAAATVSALR